MRAPTPSPKTIRFGPFIANLRSGELHKSGTKLKLQEQPFKTLALLLERAGEVVTRDEIREALWPDNTYVDFDHGINMAIAKIREALEDCSEGPQFIETVGRRGYRFIAAIELALEDRAPSSLAFRAMPYLPPAQRHSVGREKERAELASAFASAAGGSGVMVCVAGEPGIGKTTLVQDFLSGLEVSGQSFDRAIGRCSQRLAGEEAYLPFLEAVESLLRYDGALTHKLREFAPSWYAQLFPLSDENPSDMLLQEYVRSATQERVKRELTAFVCEITRQNPLVLFFDDVHWTDPSTVDLLSHLATKFDTTKILIIVTYRPSELLLLKHPFLAVKGDLSARSLCREIEVEFLSATDVERYIALEFLGNCFPREFASLIHSRTEGNPLFMVDLLRYLRDRKVIVKAEGHERWRLARSLPDLSRDIPHSVSSVIERKIDQLSDRDREVLMAAAVEGYECDSAAVARALEAENMEVEEILDRLERVHAFVRRVGEDELPSGAPTVRYRFVHVLYQNALYSSLTPARRVALSAALARALEGLYGNRTSAIASQLAFLYETAREPGRASDYLLLAAQNAQAIFANQEAIALARRGLALLAKLPETPERAQKELGLQVTLAFGFMCTLGYAAPETGANMDRARKLCQDSHDHASLCPILWGLWAYYLCKGDMKSARTAAEHVLSIAHTLNDPILLLGSHVGMAMSRLHQGELVASREHYDEVVKLYDVAQHGRYVQLYRFDPAIHSAGQMVRLLWLLGYPDQARTKAEESLALARGLSSPLSLAFIQLLAAQLYQNLRQPERTRELAEACIALCDEQAIQLERAWAGCWYGWAVAELGETDRGISQIRSALDTQLSIGAQVARSYCLAVLAEALCHAGRTEEGLQAVEDGFDVAKRNGEPFYDADLWRLKGELLTIQNKTAEAEDCFKTGIEVARQQAAKSLELRAATSLARLWQRQGRRKDAQKMLGEIYAWFTEGFDTVDVKQAALLRAEL
jgi:DNA-binding winged helix-turn-helix (wHTH) protein/tetratricopeptide (TPR) repeat protein